MQRPRIEELLTSHHIVFLEELYEDYCNDPMSVPPEWRQHFSHLGNGTPVASPGSTAAAHKSPPELAQRPAVAAVPAVQRVQLTSPTPPAPPAPPIPHLHTSSKANLPAIPHGEGPMSEEHRVIFLKTLSLFASLPEEKVQRIANIAKELQFHDDEVICHEGEPGSDLFVITSGVVTIRRDGRTLTQLGVGEVVGELAVLDSRPRSADVVASGEVRLLQLRGENFQQLLDEETDLARGLLRMLATRVREASARQERVSQLVRSYRERGHVLAKVNPLGMPIGSHPELTLEFYGLTDKDLETPFSTRLGSDTSPRPLRQILEHLHNTYCRAIGVQFMHIDDRNIQEWLRIRMEDTQNSLHLSRHKQLHILQKLTDAEVFETFLHRQFLGAKRFSLEGAESMIPLLDQAIEKAGEYQVEDVIIGMAHRGRLNVLANIMGKPISEIFREFEDIDPEMYLGSGDVKYHLGYSSDRTTESGQKVHLSLCFNPSHLEFVGPVVLGRVRAKQDRRGDTERKRVLGIIIHGDAAFAGQGVVQEMLNLSELPGYRTGGTIHLVVNNQVGFTTPPEEGRSCQYATDVARMLQIPIFHVNGENPEAVNQVIQLAMDFRDTFGKDIIIDMYCYRRHGHNEGDEPNFTQPLMYDAISKKPSVRIAYLQNLLKLNGVTEAEAEEIAVQSRNRLEQELTEARSPDYQYQGVAAGKGVWQKYKGGSEKDIPTISTGVDKEILRALLLKTTQLPASFNPHRKIKRFLKRDVERANGKMVLDWGSAEKLAFASLLAEGVSVRLSGQDAERGTFSHRHAVLHDVKNGQSYAPLAHLSETQGPFFVCNSPLSEIGVLGFDYGYSLDTPDGLVIWEAQFGDFSNVAQVITDQFISSSEDKWNRLSGLCMFLPHGFEGQGPEHSSARLERFLGLAAEENIQVCNLTTPAQIFHCIRRQVHRIWRKPLILMSPKSLLRLPEATSTLDELAQGEFQRLIPDVVELDKSKVQRIVLCSGKIYYELEAERAKRNAHNVAVLRLEQYYPFPHTLFQEQLAQYPKDTPIVWVQEEPRNMGAWPFLRLRFTDHIDGHGDHPFSYISRPESASPATGSKAAHVIEQNQLLERALTVS